MNADDYLRRCAALAKRGLGLTLAVELADAADEDLLVELEQLAGPDLTIARARKPTVAERDDNTPAHPSEGPHDCDAGIFVRSLCPEPCGFMHSFCSICKQRQDPCAHEPAHPSEEADRG